MTHEDAHKPRKDDLPWRKAYPHWWEMPEFEQLTPGQKLVYWFLRHGPQTNRIGFYRVHCRHAALTLKMSPAAFQRDLAAVVNAFAWKYDAATSVLWITSYWRDDQPDNPKHIAGLVKDLRKVPRSALDREFHDHVRYLKPVLVTAFQEALRNVLDGAPALSGGDETVQEPFRDGMRNQEHSSEEAEVRSPHQAHADVAAVAAKSACADNGFEAFWKAYPKKAGKGMAEEEWKKLRPDAALQGRIVESVKAHDDHSAQWKEEGGRYIPNPAKWLSQRGWEDEPFKKRAWGARTGINDDWSEYR